jgi:hypothetical protein
LDEDIGSHRISDRMLSSPAPSYPMATKTDALIEKIRALPAERIAEVEDFVDFVATRDRRLSALDRLLAIAPALEAAGAPPMTEQEIAAEVDAMRARRRESRGADRP